MAKVDILIPEPTPIYTEENQRQVLNLEAGNAITVTAASGSNKIQGAISYAQIDRSQENG